MRKLKEMEKAVEAAPFHQVSRTDPDTRSMVTGLRLVGVVGYNVQAAIDPDSHVIVAHEVTNHVVDRANSQPSAAISVARTFAPARRWASAPSPPNADVQRQSPRPIQQRVFRLHPGRRRLSLPRRPAGPLLSRRTETMEGAVRMLLYWSTACNTCPNKTRCTVGDIRRVRRWEHEHIVDSMEARMCEIGKFDRRSDHDFSSPSVSAPASDGGMGGPS